MTAKKEAPDANDLFRRGELRLEGHAVQSPAEDDSGGAANDAEQAQSWIVEHWRTMAEAGGAEDWLTVKPPPREWLLRRDGVPVLARRIVGLLVAPGGRGKTYALVALALAVATGRKWLDTFEVEHAGRVVLALAEEDLDEVRRRIYAVASIMSPPLTEEERRLANTRIVPLGLVGRTVALVDVVGNAVQPSALHGALEELVSAEECAMVILDPLSRWAPHVEADNAAATAAITALERLAHASRGTVIVAHHTAKWSRREGNKGESAGARGVTGLIDGVRFVSGLDGATEEDLRFVVSKSNYAPHGEPVDLVRDSTTGALHPPTSADVDFARVKASTRDRKRSAALQAAVLAALTEEPGLGRGGLRKAVRALMKSEGGADSGAVDATVDELVATGRVENRQTGQAHRYHVSETMPEVANA